MIRQSFHFEIITPCFCAGADQSRAEIRAPSIRGQLRWWFRVLGGSHSDEDRIFGNTAGDNGSSSAVRLRVEHFVNGPAWQPPEFSPKESESYVWHYARESGKSSGTGRQQAGPRWQGKGAVPPGSSFELEIIQQRPIGSELEKQFKVALEAFLILGTLGLRSTRGLGSFLCPEAPSLEAIIPALEGKGFTIRRRTQPAKFRSYTDTLKDYAAWLRYDLRKALKAERPSPLGGISPRQSSAVRFRPVKVSPQEFTWIAFEAPHARVLAPQARTQSPVLSTKNFHGSSPRDETQTRRR